MSEETKKRISKKRKGWTPSQETRIKMRLAKLGKPSNRWLNKEKTTEI
jgi:hypothetical protein